MKRVAFSVLVLPLLLTACSTRSDLTVVTKALKKQADVNLGVPDEFSGMATSTQMLFWVEGAVRNDGTEDARDVVLRFRCADGASTKVFVATVPLIPAGKTINFMTARIKSPAEIRLLDEEPEIR